VIVKSITEPGIKAEEGAAGQAGGAQQSRQPQQQQQYAGGSQSNQGGTGFNVSEQLSTEPVETKPEAVTIGNTKIIADKRVNAIIVLGNQEVKEKVFKVLDQIDVRSPQVMLNTVIGELELDKNLQLNFDYLLHFKGNGTGAATSSGSGGNIFGVSNNNAVFNTAQLIASQAFSKVFEAGSGGLSGVVATNSLDVLVNALESTNRFRITQRPMVFASNNKKAIIADGQEIAVPTQTLNSLNTAGGNNPSVSASVDYKTVAVQLEIVPLINSDREVSMDIVQKIDSLAPGTFTNVGGNPIQTIDTRYIKTNVSVPNKSTIVLGGLIKITNNRTVAGIPYLSRIPLFGTLFSNTTKDLTRRELIILIRPEVIMSPDETIAIREHEQDRLQMEPDLESTLDPPQSEEAKKRAKAAKEKAEFLNAPQPELRPGT
jgi:type II secretory pathway component GspD/PulD (secretin)